MQGATLGTSESPYVRVSAFECLELVRNERESVVSCLPRLPARCLGPVPSPQRFLASFADYIIESGHCQSSLSSLLSSPLLLLLLLPPLIILVLSSTSPCPRSFAPLSLPPIAAPVIRFPEPPFRLFSLFSLRRFTRVPSSLPRGSLAPPRYLGWFPLA